MVSRVLWPHANKVRAAISLAAGLGVLAATGALTGCGSASSSGTFVPGAPTSAPAAAATQPVASAAPLANITPFPGKVTFSFDKPSLTPSQESLVATDRDFLLAYYDAIYTKGKNNAFASYINDKTMLTDVNANVVQQIAEHRGYVGTVRFFDTTVTTAQYFAKDLSVNYCVDEARLAHTNISTGRRAADSRTPDQHYYLESDMFARNAKGTWKLVGSTVTYYPKGGAAKCKP